MIFRKKLGNMTIFFFQQIISVEAQLLIIFLVMRALNNDQTFS